MTFLLCDIKTGFFQCNGDHYGAAGNNSGQHTGDSSDEIAGDGQGAKQGATNNIETLVDLRIGFEQGMAMIALDDMIAKGHKNLAFCQGFITVRTGKHRPPHLQVLNIGMTGTI